MRMGAGRLQQYSGTVRLRIHPMSESGHAQPPRTLRTGNTRIMPCIVHCWSKRLIGHVSSTLLQANLIPPHSREPSPSFARAPRRSRRLPAGADSRPEPSGDHDKVLPACVTRETTDSERHTPAATAMIIQYCINSQTCWYLLLCSHHFFEPCLATTRQARMSPVLPNHPNSFAAPAYRPTPPPTPISFSSRSLFLMNSASPV